MAGAGREAAGAGAGREAGSGWTGELGLGDIGLDSPGAGLEDTDKNKQILKKAKETIEEPPSDQAGLI